MSQYHEPVEELDAKTRDITRALMSLKEEIEAVDWYNQRFAASSSQELKAILAHNRDEEIEHAAMILEWLRRNMDAWDDELKTYLFKKGLITELEEQAMSGEEPKGSRGDVTDLGIGSLK